MRLLLSGGKATLSAGNSSSEGRRAAMRMFAGLDVGFKRTAVCVVDEAGRIVWRGVVDTHPEALCRALQRWGGKLAKIGLESGSMTYCPAFGLLCRSHSQRIAPEQRATV